MGNNNLMEGGSPVARKVDIPYTPHQTNAFTYFSYRISSTNYISGILELDKEITHIILGLSPWILERVTLSIR